MLRVCGATQERDALSRSRCWCRGLFCGRGGGRLSTEFRRDFRNAATASSHEQFYDLIGQADLIDGEARRDKWLARFDAVRVTPAKPRKQRAAVAAQGVSRDA